MEYFKCNPGYGIFVTMDMLTDESSKVHSKPKLPQKPIAAPSKPHFKKSKLVGSRVSFFDKHNRKLYGTVRWIGKSEVNGTEEILHGIEAVSPCYNLLSNRVIIIIDISTNYCIFL